MKQETTGTVLCREDGSCLSRHVRLADDWLGRLRGLLFSPPLRADACLVILPCQQVHTHFMRYALDVVFVDREWRVVRVLRALRPWRISPWVRDAHAVIEFAAGGAAGVETGQRLLLRRAGGGGGAVRPPGRDR